MRVAAAILLTLGVTFASLADNPPCNGKNGDKGSRKEARHKKTKLRRVVNANPQHRGYPKADDKGNYPMHVDKNVYYIPE